jgi:GntR family transcriptional regulator
MSAAPAVTVDVTSPVPPYEQIRLQLAELIRHGVVPEGDRLPTVRQLAGDLGLAVGTVARAYRELELAGLVRSRRGAGTTVTAVGSVSSAGERSGLLAAQAADYVSGARRTGAADAEILAAVEAEVMRTATPPGAPNRPPYD